MACPKYEYREDHFKYYDFLERLRQSGATNMFGATPYLQEFFEELSHAEAVRILSTWMANYDELQQIRGWIR